MPTRPPHEIAGLGLEQIFRHAPVAVAVVDAAGRVIHTNDRARELTERQLGREMPGHLDDGTDIFRPDGRRYERDEWPAVRSITLGEEVVDERFYYALPDGGRLFIRCSSVPVRDKDGNVAAAVVAMVDITEDMRVADRLSYHASLLDNVDDGVIATDAEFRVAVWNPGAERLYGYAAGEVLGRPAREIATYIGDASRLRLEGELRETGRTPIEFAARRKDGTFVEVELIAVVVNGDDGEIVGYLGIHRNVTERKGAEDALAAARRGSETILERITDAFCALDRDWRFTYVNSRALQIAAQLLGRRVTREEVLGTNLWKVYPDTVGTFVDRMFRKALHEQRSVAFDYRHGPVSWDVHVYPSPDSLAVYFRDVTERRLLEEERALHARQQALVADLGLRALTSDDLNALLDEAVGLAAQALDVELVGVAKILPGSGLVLCAGIGWQPGAIGTTIGSAGRDSLVGYTVSIGEPVICEDVAGDDRFNPTPQLTAHGVVSAATVVIAGRDEPFGALAVFCRTPRSFSPSDVQFLQTVANVLSTAVERAASARRLEEVREHERSRIARDLHDEVLQGLTIALAIGEERASGGDDELVGVLRGVALQVRGAVYDLRLDGQRDQPFADALRQLVEVHRAMATPDCHLAVEIEDLPPGSFGRRGSEVLRIVGEALANARRHAGAARIVVRITSSETRICVEVTDDGRGFDADAHPAGLHGQGLQGMRERADLLDAHLDFRSDQTGTTVLLHADLRPRAASHPIKVLLVEDHAAVRQALAAAFDRHTDIDIVGQAASLSEAREQLEGVDVAVIDLGLPDGYGADLIDDLRKANPRAQALVLSATLERREIARAVARGAGGVLHKTTYLDDVVAAVRRLRAGETLLSLREIMELVRLEGAQRELEHLDRAAIAQLTPRERQILQALADGMNSQQIADRLHIAIRTVRNHIANILAKLGVHSQIQAVLLGLRYGAVEAPRMGIDPPSG